MAAGKLQSWGTDVEALKSAVAHLNQMVNLINTVFPIVGINGVSVTQVYGRGTVIKGTPFPSIPYQPQLFPVLLTYGSSPGADGTATAAASWAYTVYAVSDPGLTTPLASNIQPTKPRGLGSRARQASSVANTSYSYGTAFYGVPPSSGPNTVLLWDAGETEPALCLTGGAAC